MSQDPVALESVCYDILKAEFTSERHSETYPQMVGVDDHLHQAADSANWPAGIRYDPENDGTVLGSLGVHEHWNNASDMEYTRNLGTGDGIELLRLSSTVSVSEDRTSSPEKFMFRQNYPNPFNASTIVEFRLSNDAEVRLSVYDIRGSEVAVVINDKRPAGRHRVMWNAEGQPSGLYLCRITAGAFTDAVKIVLVR